jgi:hypothetical protein
MDNTKKTDYFNVFKFKAYFVLDSKKSSNLMEEYLDGIEFFYKKKSFFSFNKNKIIIDVYYNMNKNFDIVKNELKNNKKLLIGKQIIIKNLSSDEKTQIETFRLKIKKYLKIEIFPNKISYSKTGRLFYKIRLECIEV